MSIRLMSAVWEWDLPTSEKMVLLIIADHADDSGRNAWPSVETVGRKAGVSARQARRLILALEERGLLAVEVQAGGTRDMRDDRRPNRYSINLHGVTPVSGRMVHGVTPMTERGDMDDRHGVTPMSPKPSLEPSIEPSRELMLIQPGDSFADFWLAYPRREGKQAALRSWQRAIRTTPASAIIAGAARYRDDVNRDPQFTAHASTWINAGRWEDEPLPSRSTRATSGQAQDSAVMDLIQRARSADLRGIGQ